MAAVAVAGAELLAGCGGSSAPPAAGPGPAGVPDAVDQADETGAACDPVEEEPLDPNYLVHVLPGAPEPEYLTDPPTSGVHQPSPELGPVLDEPLPRPVQVGVLERGDVLVQHHGLGGADVEALAALAGDGVVVAPSPDLDHAVVATAWVHKLACSGVDAEALSAFAADRVGQGPGGHAH